MAPSVRFCGVVIGLVDATEQCQVVGPGRDSGHDGRRRNGRRDHDEPDSQRAPPSSQDHPAEQERRLELGQRPRSGREARCDRPIQAPPPDREGKVEKRAHLAELHGVEEREADRGQEDDRPSDARSHRQESRPGQEGQDERGKPCPQVQWRRQERERHDRERERRGVEVDAVSDGEIDGGVVQRLPLQQSIGRLEIGGRVVAEG